ncbi:MAG: hypothetical protein KAS66_00045 [Candidatus Omnitrophica bacterium]|nr:hypothetical protein [Candidatus Omnitrophota bacterium]
MIVKLRKVKSTGEFSVNVPREAAETLEKRGITHLQLTTSENGTLTYQPVSVKE